MVGVTSFPTGLQYQEALFDTSLAFRDPVLRSGSPALNPLGMPKAISGNFASVFTIRGTDGRRWAVKCFTRYVGDQAARYQKISKTLRRIASSWKVGFEYLPDGVLCQGTWYPVLKMEWVEATGLLPFVEAHLTDKGTLGNLVRKFGELVSDLSRHSIAHGDLQHGNILVTPSGELKLIDYDGMFVPGMKGLGASELGHANYQSPLRNASDWGPDIDRFSSWVIYASLRALALDPALWSALHVEGDEALLFHKDDFTDRDHSHVRSLLTSSSVPEVREIAKDIDFLWAPDLAAVPPLGAISGLGSTPATPSSAAAGAASQGNPIGTAAWLTTHFPIAPPVEFTRPAMFTRVVSAVLLGFVMLFAVLAGIGAKAVDVVGFTTIAVEGLTLFWIISLISYEFSPVRRDGRRSRRIFGKRKRAVTRTDRIVSRLEKEVGKLARETDNFKSKMTNRADKARADERRELAAVDKQLEAEIARLDRQINELPGKGGAEERSALSILQKSHVDGHLRAARISSGRIPGIGAKLATTLSAHGILTAADFTGVRGANLVLRNGRLVSPLGIGVAKAQSLDNWRRTVESVARLSQPTILPRPQRDAIRDKYAAQMKSLATSKQAASAQAAKQKGEMRHKWDTIQKEIAKDLSEGIIRFTRLRADKEALLAAARKQADTATLQRDYAKRELDRYQQIRYRRYLRRIVTG